MLSFHVLFFVFFQFHRVFGSIPESHPARRDLALQKSFGAVRQHTYPPHVCKYGDLVADVFTIPTQTKWVLILAVPTPVEDSSQL